MAQIGAALGRSFSYELISAVAGMPQQKLDEALDQLASAELIFRRGMPPDAEYTFKHALVQDAAYSTLLRSRRQQIACPHCRDLGKPIPGDRRSPAGAHGSALCRGRLTEKGSRLLAQGRSAGGGALGDG